jgi:hypothetical protein
MQTESLSSFVCFQGGHRKGRQNHPASLGSERTVPFDELQKQGPFRVLPQKRIQTDLLRSARVCRLGGSLLHSQLDVQDAAFP